MLCAALQQLAEKEGSADNTIADSFLFSLSSSALEVDLKFLSWSSAHGYKG